MKLDVQAAEKLREDFEALLDKNGDEQEYQAFLEQHTELIPHEFVQNHGIHLTVVVRKLSFGADFKSDFFYFSKSSDDWNAVFIELEKPSARLFRKNSNDLSPELLKGIDQIKKWRAWLASGGASSFLSKDAKLLHVPAHMAMNPTHFKFVLVIGRRSEYEGNADRRARLAQEEDPSFKILTYDSLLENLKHKHPVYVVSRHNDHLDFLNDEYVDGMVFSQLDPSQVKLSEKMIENMKSRGPDITYWRGKGSGWVDAINYTIEHARRRP